MDAREVLGVGEVIQGHIDRVVSPEDLLADQERGDPENAARNGPVADQIEFLLGNQPFVGRRRGALGRGRGRAAIADIADFEHGMGG